MMSVDEALRTLRLEPKLMTDIALWRRLPAQPARYAPYPAALDARLGAALSAHGLGRLYTHQATAITAALGGDNVAVVTPTASGKTFCYNLPVLHRLLNEPGARALYLFPTKALAQDQLASLHDLVALLDGGQGATEAAGAGGRAARRPAGERARRAAPSLLCATYDGDTPPGQRARVRDEARIVLSNPDMLHAGILPQHTRWSAFFAHLRVVVIDEMHVYRGVFGSHVANVLRRLRRICRFYGSDPQFILASATIANPRQLAERLIEAPVTLVGPEQNGAPQGEKHILLCNPPMIDPALGIRRGAGAEAAELAAHFLAHDVQTIVFAGSRLMTELILLDLRGRSAAFAGPPDAITDEDGDLVSEQARNASLPAEAIRGYRGGYLPGERREIERGLREGRVRGVIATNALELGIDIGRLGAALLAGYPGTIASAWQQMGRAGRRQETALAALVASPAALDQYIIAHPEYLFGASPEHALINPNNPIILADHLLCAAAEIPFGAGEGFGGAPQTPEVLAYLAGTGDLYQAGGRYFWGGEGYPAANVSLRTESADRVLIQALDAAGKPQVIGEMERSAVLHLAYEGAIYIHSGETYLVERLDWEGGAAYVRPVSVDYYTRASVGEEVRVLAEHAARPCGALSAALPPAGAVEDQAARPTPPPEQASRAPDVRPQAGLGGDASTAQAAGPGAVRVAWGAVRVVSKATGYRIQRRGSHEVLGFGVIDLPEQTLDTTACWLSLGQELIDRLKESGEWLSDPNEYGPNWQAQRAAARARDGYRCANCGTEERAGKQHDVHHKIPFRAFVGDPSLRPGLSAADAWQAANVLDNLVTLCHSCHRLAEAAVRTRSGLGGMAALLAGVAPLHLMCDPRDLGVVVEPQAPDTKRPTITLFERVPAGIGYAEELYNLMPDLLRAAYDLVQACPCERGCPACVGPVLDHDYALDTKMLTTALLRALAG